MIKVTTSPTPMYSILDAGIDLQTWRATNDGRDCSSFSVVVSFPSSFTNSSSRETEIRWPIVGRSAMSYFAKDAAYRSSVIVHATNDFYETFGVDGQSFSLLLIITYHFLCCCWPW